MSTDPRPDSWFDPDEDYWEWDTCPDCAGEGVSGHDCPCGDTCCCLRPEENRTCQTCDGEGGWEPPLPEQACDADLLDTSTKIDSCNYQKDKP